MNNMDQELSLEQRNQQISTLLKIVAEFVEEADLAQVFAEIDKTFPDVDFFNSKFFKISFPKIEKSKNPKAD